MALPLFAPTEGARPVYLVDSTGAIITGATGQPIVGNVASGATDSGAPVKVGGVYNSTLPTLTNGQRGDLQVGTRGSLNVTILAQDGTGAAYTASSFADAASNSATNQGSILALSRSMAFNGTSWDRIRGDTNGLAVQSALSSTFWVYAAASGGIDNSATAVTIKAAAAAGVRNYLKTLEIAHATLGASTELAIRDGAAGTVLWRTLLHTTALPTTTFVFDPPLKGTAATLLEVVTLTAVTGDVMINAQGYTGA
jgi:hypothetical protein